MALSDFAFGMNQAVQEQRKERMLLDQLAERVRQSKADEDFRNRELELRGRQFSEQSEALNEQRTANADLRRQNAAHRLTQDLGVGDELDPTAAGTLRGANLGGLIQHQDAHLPSTQIAGFQSEPGAAKPAAGFLRTASAGNAERDVFRGTPAQRKADQQRQELRRLIDSMPQGRERQALEFQYATGDNAPAGVFPPRDPTPHYSLHQTFDESGQPDAAVRFNSVTGEAAPINVGGGFLRTGTTGQRSRGVPARLQGVLMDLSGRHANYRDALEELRQLQANAPDEQFDWMQAATALRNLYAQPQGQMNPFEQAAAGVMPGGGALLAGNGGAGTGQGSSPAQAANGAQLRERRMINGQLGEWDGRGWKPVTQ